MRLNTLHGSRFMFFYFLSGFCTRKTNRKGRCRHCATENSLKFTGNLGGTVPASFISVRFASTETTQKTEKHETASMQGV